MKTLTEAANEFISKKQVNEISNSLKRSYLKQAIADLEWFAGHEYDIGFSDDMRRQWAKRRKSVMKMVDNLTKGPNLKFKGPH